MKKYTYDIEATGLLGNSTIDYTSSPYSLKPNFDIHCVVVQSVDDGSIIAFYDGDTYTFDGREYNEVVEGVEYSLGDYQPLEYTHKPLKHFKKFIKNNPNCEIIGHNILDYDNLACKLFFDMDYTIGHTLNDTDTWCGNDVLFSDTMILSKTLNPDRHTGHSLEKLAQLTKKSEKFDFRKHIKPSDRFLHCAADMIYYCIRDVMANTHVYNYLQWERTKDDWNWDAAIRLEHKIADIVTKQSHRGFDFDEQLAEECVSELDAFMKERKNRVEPLLPLRKATRAFINDHTPPSTQILEKDVTIPKRFTKIATGELTDTAIKWLDKWSATYNQENECIILNDGTTLEKELDDVGNFKFPEVAFSNKTISAHMKKFVERHQGKYDEDNLTVTIYGKTLSLPIVDPLKTEMVATINDTTHIKDWLVGLGWNPSEYKMKDITLKSGTKIKRDAEDLEKAVDRYVLETFEGSFKKDRCNHLSARLTPNSLKNKIMKKASRYGCKVKTNPSFTVGQEKDLCPDLERVAESFPYVNDVVQYLTYKHRRNSILGGGLDWEEGEDAEKGYMANLRDDGRISTPADTCGTACVVADTLILSDKGTVPIIDINKGDLVLTHNGVYGKVIDLIDNGIKPTKKVSFKQGNEVTCTYNHRFLTTSGWKKAEDLEEGDEVYSYQGRERWGQVEGFSNYYVSSWGRVRGNRGKILKIKSREKLWSGAEVELIGDNGKRKGWGIGALVLSIFKEVRPLGKECCHKDGNPCNNFLDNLYWGTSKENSADAKRHGRALKAARNNVNSKLTEETVEEIKQHFLDNEYSIGMDGRIGRRYGVRRETIRDIRLGKRWVTGNTTSIYKEEFKTDAVVSVIEHDEVPTYDLTVEDHHSYLTNGVVCHNTSRFKHRVVVNIPRPASLYGKQLRSLFGVTDEYLQVGFDFANLEARIEAHYTHKYDKTDNKDYCKSLIQPQPYDTHTLMAKEVSNIIGQDFTRQSAKAVRYACAYGAQATKISETIGANLETGEKIFATFWEVASPLNNLKLALTRWWKSKGDKKFIVGIDGRKVPTRFEHALLNSLFQSGGVICAKQTAVFLDKLLEDSGFQVDFFSDDWENSDYVSNLIMMHDEQQLEQNKSAFKFKSFSSEDDCKAYMKDNDDVYWSDIIKKNGKFYIGYSDATQLIREAVYMTNDHFNLKMPLACDYSLGKTWAECH